MHMVERYVLMYIWIIVCVLEAGDVTVGATAAAVALVFQQLLLLPTLQ